MSEIKKLTIGQDELDLSKYTPNNGTLTIQQNGTTVDTFTANSSADKTVNIETITADDYIDTTALTPIVSTSMIEDGAVTAAKLGSGAVTAAKTAFGGNYSTTEVNTGFTWIDGKPIYKKTINTGSLPNATTKTVAHGISNIGIVVKYEAIATFGSNSTQIPIPFVSDNFNAQIGIRVEPTDIVLWCQTNRSSATSYVTLWYTKTTD